MSLICAIKAGLNSVLTLSFHKAILLVTLIFIIALFVGKRIRFSKFVTWITGGVALVSIISGIFMAIALFVSSQPSLGGWARQTYHDFIVDAPSQKAGAGVGRLMTHSTQSTQLLGALATLGRGDGQLGGESHKRNRRPELPRRISVAAGD